MCGIVGFIDNRNRNLKNEILEEMKNTIIHRGPSSDGSYIDDKMAMGFRRLSIIDLEGGTQPISNEDDSMVLTFNGEIYNFLSIKEDLLKKGHVFKTNTDTEVILHGYEEYGKEIVKKLRGMFAFVIWNKETGELFGARDHFGIKPFYYYKDKDLFIYGSEIKSFLKHPQFKKEINKKALRPYLVFQYSAMEETFFKNVFKLSEGHYFTYKDNDLKIEEYWDYENKINENMTLDEAVNLIDDAVKESVEAHRIADVKVGSFLSSGVDSSFVTSVLRPEMSYSTGFGSGSKFNEQHEAKKLADILKINNTSKEIDSETAFRHFPLIQYFMDEPDSNPSCVPLFFLCQMAAKDFRVVQSGEGADELFAGYQSYGFNSKSKPVRVITEILKKLPAGVQHSIADFIKDKNFHGQLHLYSNLSKAEDEFIGNARVFEEEEAVDILQEEYKNGATVKEIVQPIYDRVKDIPNLKKKQYLDLHLWMPRQILAKADKLSMANSLEVRVPLLDIEMFKVSEQIPTRHLLNEHETKYAFRKAASRHIPESWFNRPKLGFPVPIALWLKNEDFYRKVRETFSKDYAREFFDQEKILNMLDDNFHGKNDARRKIWTIYSFLVWYEIYFINNGAKPEIKA